MSEQQQIAPCPFCGASGDDIIVVNLYYGSWVKCEKCKSEGPCEHSINDAKEKWNIARNKLDALEQKLSKAEATNRGLEYGLKWTREVMSELCNAVTARFSTDNPTGEHTLRLFRAIDAARKALDLK